MPFEFAFLDWLYQFRNPVMNTISIFFDYAGAHGEIWIAFTLLLLLFRCTRKAGFAMAVALVLYMAAGHFFLKPLDRERTRLDSRHLLNSYCGFFFEKKKKIRRYSAL